MIVADHPSQPASASRPSVDLRNSPRVDATEWSRCERRVYEPEMGSGTFFIQSESRNEAETASRRLPAGRAKRGNFIEEHGGKLGQFSVYGQESNPTIWRLAAMNMAIRGIDFTAQRGSASKQRGAIPQSVSAAKDHFGKEPANSFTSDQRPDHDFVRLRFATAVMANPPFNMSEWWDAKLEGDPRWSRSEAQTAPQTCSLANRGNYGTPPKGNANFAWIQHMLHHLAPNGSMALLLANSASCSIYG